MAMTNVYLHPTVCSPDAVEAVQQQTGLIVAQSTTGKNKIILVDPAEFEPYAEHLG